MLIDYAGPFSVDLPMKDADIQQITPPTGQPFLFSAPQPSPTPQFRTEPFTTPRRTTKLNLLPEPVDQNTPDNGDTEETPDAPPGPRSVTRSNSKALAKSASTPTQPNRMRYSDKSLLKVNRKRRQQRIEEEEESGDDIATSQQVDGRGSRSASQQHEPRLWSETHRDIPYVLSSYLQLFVNMCFVALIFYCLFLCYKTIQQDVAAKVEEYSSEILQEMAQCSKDYLDNRCAPDQRVPAMDKPCIAWERCMNRDPAAVGRAKVSAETFAEIIESFMAKFSYKTMVSSHLPWNDPKLT